MKQEKFKRVEAITLIALVITIIVLLILAGVTVATLTGENGLLSKAQLAKERNMEAENNEKDKLSSYEDEINKIFGDRNTAESISRDEIINLIKQYANPTGTIIAFSANQDLTGYLKCEGQAVSRTTYSALFNVIGTTYGEGDGSTTFNLPDLRGEFLRGAGDNSHENQGDGEDVGEHQDATNHAYWGYNKNNDLWVQSSINNNNDINAKNVEKITNSTVTTGLYWRASGTFSGNGQAYYNARPTNTSVLYCIKY